MADLFTSGEGPREMIFVVPGEVRGKGRPRARIVKPNEGSDFVSVYTDAKTRAYESRIGVFATSARAKARWPLAEGALRMDCIATFAIPKSWSKKKTAQHDGQYAMNRIDGDNIIKSLLDGMNQMGIFVDDKQFVIVTCTKRWTANPLGEQLQVKVSRCG